MSHYPEVKVNEKGKKREIRNIIIGEERKLSLFIDNMIFYPKNSGEYIKNYLSYLG